MEEREFEGVDVTEQLAALEARALDTRPSLTTPFPSLNEKLHRGGFHPGELVVLGGRMHTRKTGVMLNTAVHLLRHDVPVGILSLDESLAMYTSKLMSVVSRQPSSWLEDNWSTKKVEQCRQQYEELAQNLTLSRGVRPNIKQLQEWLEMADVTSERPRVVFIDYASLLVHYRRGGENERVMRLMEELQVWTHDNELVTVALHQAGRSDEGVSKRYHGDTPMTAEALLYGGEAQADIVLTTYRPALNQLGNMSQDQAEMILGDSFDEEKWEDARARVRKYRSSTFLQLLKNRPGTELFFEGVELVSPAGTSQYMEQKGEGVTETAEWKGQDDAEVD